MSKIINKYYLIVKIISKLLKLFDKDFYLIQIRIKNDLFAFFFNALSGHLSVFVLTSFVFWLAVLLSFELVVIVASSFTFVIKDGGLAFFFNALGSHFLELVDTFLVVLLARLFGGFGVVVFAFIFTAVL